jgi:hypothetical protein
VTLKEERRLRAFENGMLRRIFGPKINEVREGGRNLHNGELHSLYSLQKNGKVKEDETCRTCYRIGVKQNEYTHRLLLGKSERKILQASPRCT